MYEIGKTFEFCAAQRLDHMPDGHPCRAQHGHTYYVTVILQADKLDEFDMVLDYHELKPIKQWIHDRLDHSDLNKYTSKPTAENLARLFYIQFRHLLGEHQYLLRAVKVQESPKTYATFWG